MPDRLQHKDQTVGVIGIVQPPFGRMGTAKRRRHKGAVAPVGMYPAKAAAIAIRRIGLCDKVACRSPAEPARHAQQRAGSGDKIAVQHRSHAVSPRLADGPRPKRAEICATFTL